MTIRLRLITRLHIHRARTPQLVSCSDEAVEAHSLFAIALFFLRRSLLPYTTRATNE